LTEKQVLVKTASKTGFQEVAKRIGVTQSLFVLEQAGSVQGHPASSQFMLKVSPKNNGS
jgi:hypothetical protein